MATINDNNIFTIIHMNARNIVCNFDAITTYLNSLSFNCSIIIISETWLKSYNKDIYELEYYNYVHTIRDNDIKGGGTSINIKKMSNFTKIENLSLSIDNDFDIVTIRLNIRDINISTLISAIYKQSNTDIINFKDHILQYFNNLTINNDVFIIGDFNMNILNHNLNTNVKYFIDDIFSLGLYKSLIVKSTIISDHSHSLIDNIYCNKKNHPILKCLY